jgi:transmembrane sensor
MTVAAGLGLTAIVVVFRGLLIGPAVPIQQSSFATLVGQQREIQLVDGTEVLLNTDSELRVDYTREVRRVELVNGEAYFDVRPNAARAFLVEANGRQVRAIGTVFTVVEGSVELTEVDGAGARADGAIARVDLPQTRSAPVLLQAGQNFRLASTDVAAEVIVQSPRELQRALSWQEGIHDFSATPLEDVVREVNRYSTLEIEIADPALRALEFGGIFRVGDTQPLLHALETSYGVSVERLGPNRVHLSRAATGDPALQPDSARR